MSDVPKTVEAGRPMPRETEIQYPTRPHRRLILLLAALGIFVTAAFSATFGSVAIPLETSVQMVATKVWGAAVGATWSPSWETILFDIRLPRIVLAGLVGGALATSGVTYQGLLRNPLADPYLIGVSSGAALGATVAIVFPVNVVMFAVEVTAGLAAGSASLQADALDFLGDAGNYAISLFVVGMALQYRAIAAFLKGATMGLFGLWVLGVAAWHVWHGTLPHAFTMGAVGASRR